MKDKLCMLLCIIIIIYAAIPRVYAAEGYNRLWEEDTSEYEEEAENVFSPASVAEVTGADSFVDKTAGPSAFDVPCKAAFLVEEKTGRILYEKKADEQLPMASITKIMTMLLVIEAVETGKITINDTVPITPYAFSMGGSQIWLEPGEIFTVDELMKAVAVSSANDAAVALAEYVGGSEEAFCEMMNRKAEELGMENTHFVNACGLDADNHYSTARDVSIMAAEIMRHPVIYDYSTIWMDYLRGGETQLVNTNKLLRSYNGVTGLKTGTTSGAGVCICATARRENLSLIAVVLGSDSSQERFSAARKLLDFGFSNFETRKFPEINIPSSVKVRFGREKQVPIMCNIPYALLFAKGATSRLTVETDIPEYVEAPMYRGMKIGSITLMGTQGKIRDYDIVIGQDVLRTDLKYALSLLTKKLAAM